MKIEGWRLQSTQATFKLVKACLAEVEFLSNQAALNSVNPSNESGAAIKNAFGQSVARDIFYNILNQL